MNKKQICKVSFSSRFDANKTLYDGYGICIGNDMLLLENGGVFDSKQHRYSENLFVCTNDTYSKRDFRDCVGACDVTNTRCVPQEIREAMEAAADSAIQMLKLYERFEESKQQFNRMMKEREGAIKVMPSEIRKSRGVLSKQEFLQAFLDALPQDVSYAMKHSTQRGYNGMDGEYKASIYNHIQIHRSVWIDKWAEPDFAYREYDDTWQIRSDAESYPSYQKLLKQYHKPLPVSKSAGFEEYLSIGDKRSLEYECTYIVRIDPDKPLTKDYAQKLAYEFCGQKRDKYGNLTRDPNEIDR